jgi:hypothetical protein
MLVRRSGGQRRLSGEGRGGPPEECSADAEQDEANDHCEQPRDDVTTWEKKESAKDHDAHRGEDSKYAEDTVQHVPISLLMHRA